jgi:Zn-dependent protease with chaperone function
MFLPFLPLILASLGLSLLVLPMLPEKSLIPLETMETLILLLVSSLWFGQWQSQSRKTWVRAFPRLAVAGLWVSLNWATRLPIELATYWEGIQMDQAAVVYLLVLFYWVIDGLASHPWRRNGQKWSKTIQTLRLQLPLILMTGLHLGLTLLLDKTIQNDAGSNRVLVELGLSVLILLGAAPWLVVLSWGMQPVPQQVRDEINTELKANHTSVQCVFCWPEHITQTATAGVIGILPWARFLLVSPQLLDHLNSHELRAVIAHEAGHLRRWHLFFYALAFLGFVELLFLILVGVEFTHWVTGFKVPDWLQGFLLIGLLAFFFRGGIGFLSRNFERQADCNAFLRCGWEPFATALTKVGYLNRIALHQDNWHHYGIQQRLEFLKLCEEQPEKISLHDQRVQVIQGGCLLLFGLLLSASAYSTTHHAEESLIFWRLENIVSETTSADVSLLIQAANTFYEKSKFERAEELYRQALVWEPENPSALNNLAWLLTQHFAKEPLKVQESVRLAERAVKLEPAAYILDTLAESYALQERWQEAADVARTALEQAESDIRKVDHMGLRYYQDRMEHFQHTHF